MRIEITPLSVNQAWQGKRFKSPKYRAFEKELLLKLKPIPPIEKGEKLKVTYIFGVKNMQRDVDNMIKQFQDCLSKKYNFNDSQIQEFTASKIKSKVEYVEFEIEKLE